MKLLRCLALLGLALNAHAEAPTPPALPDPASVRIDQLQLMEGFPPPADKRVTVANLRQYPNSRWAFHHMRELFPSRLIDRGTGPVSVLPRGQDLSAQIDALRFTGASGELSFADYLDSTYVDGAIVLHRGQVVYERYFGLPENAPHIMWSMTKSVTGLLATALIQEGRLKADALVTDYLPELAESGWKGATVQQVLDMTADVNYSEVYADAQSDVIKYGAAAGMLALPADYPGARSIYAYLPTIGGNGNHGQEFQYRTVHTEVLGWILRRVTGQNTAELFSERLWSKLGTEHDAYLLLDPHGTEWAGAGMNASLRDLARFGEMLRNEGRFNGQQIIPAAVLAEIRKGASQEHFRAANRLGQDGYSYHNQFWISHNADGAYVLLGVHGQMIYVNPAAELVLVRLSSHPIASSGATFGTTAAAMQTLADWLRKR